MLKFPEYAQKCIDTITQNGFSAYFVGGCVRDGLLGRACDDIDIATSALPNEIISLFERTVPTGLKHGTVTVLIDDHPIEVTTFRRESGYNDSRHPDSVSFVSNIQEDLSRRDFTINALAATSSGEIVDLFGGLKDLEKGIIRAVGDPETRFTEDALRIVRAFRFACVLGFEIEEKTKKAALKSSERIEKISGERVLKELYKAASYGNLLPLCELISSGALECFGISNVKLEDACFNRLSSLELSPSSKLALLILMCDFDIDLIKNSLKADNHLVKKIKITDSLAACEIPEIQADVQKLLYMHHHEYVRLYFYYLGVVNLADSEKLFNLYNEVCAQDRPYRISHLSVDGNDILELGLQGKEIKTSLENALFAVIDGKIENTKESIIGFLKN